MNPLTMTHDEARIIEELAAQVGEIARKPLQHERRELWRSVNSLKRGRPPVYVLTNELEAMGKEILTEDKILCRDPFLRRIEYDLRYLIFKDGVGDDHVVEPFYTVPAVLEPYGREYKLFQYAPKVIGYLKGEEDLDKFGPLHHGIDEGKTKERFDFVTKLFGGHLQVDISRRPAYTSMVHLDEIPMMFGMEEFLYAVIDRPDFVKQITKLVSDGLVQMTHDGERSGDLSASAFAYNQAQPYCRELPDPEPNRYGLKLSQLWGWTQAQCYGDLSPEMTKEFLYDYQFPLAREFGLTGVGCCEDLTRKIPILKEELPNLRRVSISPWSDVARCADQLEDRYVLSWRPNPATMICCDWDPAYVRRFVRENLETMRGRGCHMDITLKDVQTVRNEPWRFAEWVRIVHDTIDGFDW